MQAHPQAHSHSHGACPPSWGHSSGHWGRPRSSPVAALPVKAKAFGEIPDFPAHCLLAVPKTHPVNRDKPPAACLHPQPTETDDRNPCPRLPRKTNQFPLQGAARLC